MRLCVILVLVALAATALTAHAAVHYVDLDGGSDFDNLSAAVNAAAEGDTISVAPGTYTGPDNRQLNPFGINMVILAESGGRTSVVIDCENVSSAFLFNSGENPTTVVRGFTIRNGENTSGGGGIRITNASPTIEGCTFISCSTTQSGGAVYLSGSSSTVSDCVFRWNGAQTRGGALYSNLSSTLITGCLFDENMVAPGSSGGAAVYCRNGSETITSCTVVENGLNQIYVDDDSGVTISHCVIANGSEGVGVAATGASIATVTRCVLFGNPGGDPPECDHDEIIYQDPLFCDDAADNYTLCDDSSAVAYNNMWNELLGAYGSSCEPCGTPVEDVTWGVIKALFR